MRPLKARKNEYMFYNLESNVPKKMPAYYYYTSVVDIPVFQIGCYPSYCLSC